VAFGIVGKSLDDARTCAVASFAHFLRGIRAMAATPRAHPHPIRYVPTARHFSPIGNPLIYMHVNRLQLIAALGLIVCAAAPVAQARDLHISIPARSKLTPVQRLNRDGVEAVQKHQYDKAEALFYKAYLFDPVDPFTLNNLGYVSELQGQLERAETFYKLAAEQGCGAIIDRSDEKDLRGKPMMYAIDGLRNSPMRVNRMNIRALELLAQDHGFAAEAVLEQALKLDPQNAFTLNNLGVANETVGDYESALKYYDEVAASRTKDPVVIALNPATRGKPLSEVAAHSAANLRNKMRNMDVNRAQATMLEVRGVYEINENNWDAARQDFLDAYKADPNSAFTLNNLGYVSERDGDLETAQFFYDRARKASDANVRVGLASQAGAQGTRIASVAGNSTHKVDSELQVYTQERRSETGPIELTPRYGTSQPEPAPANPKTPQQR
jgi:Flp pilus assembly protein TadD